MCWLGVAVATSGPLALPLGLRPLDRFAAYPAVRGRHMPAGSRMHGRLSRLVIVERVGVPPEDDTCRPKPSMGFPCWYAHEPVGPQQLPGPSRTMVYSSAANVVAELISPALIRPATVSRGTQSMRLDSKSSSGAPMRVALSAW
jgi:hypothetical protein